MQPAAREISRIGRGGQSQNLANEFPYVNGIHQKPNHKRAQSPYINPFVTVIKWDGRVRLCLDARKINSVTTPDYEGPPPNQ